jgi:urease accessory protein
MDLQNHANIHNKDPLGVANCHAFASLLLYGSKAQAVQERCEALQDVLAAQHTRIRERATETPFDNDNDNDHHLQLLQQLAGKVYMGTSRVAVEELHDSEAHVVRLAATTNEDLYRIFHHCLLPLESSFGMEFYKERIRAKASEIPRLEPKPQLNGSSSVVVNDKKADGIGNNGLSKKNGTDVVPPLATAVEDDDSVKLWSAYMLADSSLPTGSFAHSAGLETAVQLGMVQDEEDLQTFIQAATRSTLQVTIPFVLAAHRLALSNEAHDDDDDDDIIETQWKQLHQQTQAVLASNAPACAASLDQGKSLGRVAVQWLATKETEKAPKRHVAILKCVQVQSHFGPVLGALSALLDLNERQVCRLLGYCIARDMVSAAVRLSLVGPLASIQLLRDVQEAAEDGYQASQRAMQEHNGNPMAAAAASAPVIEALHPCHDVLQVRLFRS